MSRANGSKRLRSAKLSQYNNEVRENAKQLGRNPKNKTASWCLNYVAKKNVFQIWNTFFRSQLGEPSNLSRNNLRCYRPDQKCDQTKQNVTETIIGVFTCSFQSKQIWSKPATMMQRVPPQSWIAEITEKTTTTRKHCQSDAANAHKPTNATIMSPAKQASVPERVIIQIQRAYKNIWTSSSSQNSRAFPHILILHHYHITSEHSNQKFVQTKQPCCSYF